MNKLRTLLVCSLLLAGASHVCATSYITLQSGDTHTFYQSVAAAYEDAVDGDVIIIPGGSWTMPSPIEKELTFIGAGYDPRYSAVTGITMITNSIIVGADNVSIEGYYFSGNISLSGERKNIVIRRCKVANILGGGRLHSNILVVESVLLNVADGGFGGTRPPTSWHNNLTVSNCFIVNSVNRMTHVIFMNNVIFGSQYHTVQHCTFKNNILIHVPQMAGASSSNYYLHNIVLTNFSGVSRVIDINNLLDIPAEDIFEVVPETWTYDFETVYRLKDDSPARNAGEDGTDCGVWGGRWPWKETAVPMIPHIREMEIAPVTNAGGKLQIRFQVEAQSN